MREYYGELSNCLEYVEDKNYKAIPWKGYAFSFELRNSTNYTLELKRGKIYHSFATVEPLVGNMEGKVYIAPIFKNGIITIVTCEDCRPNFGIKPKHKIIPLKEPAKKIKVCNFTPYDLIISTGNTVIQRIEANKKRNEQYPSKFIGIPYCIRGDSMER